MKETVQTLRADLFRIQSFLEQGPGFSLSDDEKQRLHTEVDRLLLKLDSLEENLLTVGLLGGTGVGKSTLMNALAGAEIASAHHRRPHTDKILIYRHRDAEGVNSVTLDGVPWGEITHNREPLRRVLLCDLPDFDSLISEHRHHVIRFLEHLDLLVWISSPEKYGDGLFYEFLSMVPKAKQNFFFVLNKMDLLFHGSDQAVGYEEMVRVVERFGEHLEKEDMIQPVIYALSAEEVLRSPHLSPWNHFPTFRQQVFQQRDMKEIRGIKSANLGVEVQALASVLKAGVRHLAAAQALLETSLEELDRERPRWSEDVRKTLGPWVEEECRQAFLGRPDDMPALVGPGHGLALLFQEMLRFSGKNQSSTEWTHPRYPPEPVLSHLSETMEGVKNRLRRHVLVRNLPGPVLRRFEEVMAFPARMETLKNQLSLTAVVQARGRSGLSRFWFRLRQYTAYTSLLLILFVSLSGEEAWRGFLDRPGPGTFLQIIVSTALAFFTAKGLAGLASYLLLNVWLGFRFYRSHRRLMEVRAHRAAEKATEDLLSAWEGNVDALFEDLRGFRDEILSGISAMESLSER